MRLEAVLNTPGGNEKKAAAKIEQMAQEPDDKLYQAEYHGSGTFAISKPKRKTRKLRQSRLKNRQRGARK
jgi:hypothetical protein